jgi:hypothetical protein
MEEQKQTPAADEMYCPSCGSIVKREAEICVRCGVRMGKHAVGRPEKGRSAMPVAGGVLGIIAGVFPVVGGLALIIISAVVGEWRDSFDWAPTALGIALIALGVLAVVGSSYAISRRNFVLAVIGGVCAVFSMWLLGIPALILIALSSREFNASEEA